MRAKERDLQAIQTLNQKSNLKHKEQKNYTIVYKSTSQYPQIRMDTFGYFQVLLDTQPADAANPKNKKQLKPN
jgi:hypothetical protein